MDNTDKDNVEPIDNLANENDVDGDIVAEQSHSKTMKDKLLSAEHWLRFVFMILFALIACVASYVVTVLICIQFVFALVTGGDVENSDNGKKLREFGHSLAQYLFQILKFLTYNSEEKPFPFADWPQTKDEE